MPLMRLFVQAFPGAALLLVSIVWLPLALRYRFRRVALAALFVMLCSTLIPLLFTYYIEMRRETAPLAGVEGEWPSVMVAAGQAGLCDFFLPIICFGVIFSLTTLMTATALEIHRAMEKHRIDHTSANTSEVSDSSENK
jgi:hypothetical protein